MPALDFIHQLLGTLRLADLIDMALVALLLYALLSWLRWGTSPTTSRRVLALLLIFGTVYLLADTFELYLVESLLQVLFLVLLVAVVVVFQAELRRLLTRLGRLSFQGPLVRADEATSDLLVEATAHLAETKTGALLALKGQEPWDDHVHGGVRLDGVVSQPLLYSLFNPETPGHDGAVLLEGKHITRFAAHLPLAADLPEVSRFGGTRHAAALGLAEQCDALVIVVSEERGVVSVAQAGRLDELASPGDLKRRLKAFWRRHDAQAGRSRSRRWLPRLQTASLSLVLALFLWLFFAYSPDTVSRTVELPVEFRNLPDDWELAANSPDTLRATLAGSERAFGLIDREALAVSFDLSAPQEGSRTLSVSEDHLDLPAGLRLRNVEPRQVRVEARRLTPVEVPVEVPTLGSPPRGPVRVALEPETVTLLLPQEGAERPRRVLTEPLDLREVTGEGTVERPLVLPPGWRLPEGQAASVTVRVSVQE